MDYPNTPHVRIHTDITPTGRYLGFFGRCLMDQLLKTCNRAGILKLPGELKDDPYAAVAVAIDCPDVEWVREYLPRLEARSSVRWVDDKRILVLPNYHEGQYSTINGPLASRLSKQKFADTEEAMEHGWIEKPQWLIDHEDRKERALKETA